MIQVILSCTTWSRVRVCRSSFPKIPIENFVKKIPAFTKLIPSTSNEPDIWEATWLPLHLFPMELV